MLYILHFYFILSSVSIYFFVFVNQRKKNLIILKIKIVRP